MPPFAWPKVEIDTPDGRVPATAPLIVSASRATDIPAFYADWLVRRLRAGWVRRTNPFNRREEYVSLATARVIVFWSKDPAPLIPRLDEIDALGVNYYVTCTVNDYQAEGLEPGLPPLDERLATFRRLSKRIGPDRVVWRFDPIVLGGGLTPARILERIARVGEALHPHTGKLVISFADILDYRTVEENLRRAGHGDLREPIREEVLAIAAGIERLNRDWGLAVATCAESADLSAYGIGHNRCIDGDLMRRCFPNDRVLREFLAGAPDGALKDRGQRKNCGCIVSRDIGRYDTCPHGCVYCYANSSPGLAGRRHADHSPDADQI